MAVPVEPMKSMLKTPGTKRLKLKYDKQLSSVAFNFSLRRYKTGSQSSDLRHELDAALAALAAAEETAKSNSGAASEVRTLKDSMKERVEFAVKDRLFAADKRVAELEVAADAAAEAQGRADAALSEMRRLHEGRAVATLRA